jgi:hypothetical protein
MDVSHEPRFWYGYLSCAFGQRGPSFDPEVLSKCFGVNEEVAHKWWNEFTGWYDGVLDEADGQVDEPGLFEILLVGGDFLVVEAHPGDTYVYRRRSNDQPQETIANFGPHWLIPEWRLAGVLRVAGNNPFAFLILSPLVRLGTEEDRATAEELFIGAWVSSGLLERAAATRLAREWCRCAAAEE